MSRRAVPDDALEIGRVADELESLGSLTLEADGLLADAGVSEILWPNPKTGPWGIRANWVTINGREECAGLAIWRGAIQDPNTPLGYRPIPGTGLEAIRATALRELPMAAIIARLRRDAERRYRLNDQIAIDRAEQLGAQEFAEELRAARTKGPWRLKATGAPRRHELAHFVEVAGVYLEALAAGLPPTKAVAEHFPGASRSQAAKWVERCRGAELQLLSPAEHGKAGAQPGPALIKMRKAKR